MRVVKEYLSVSFRTAEDLKIILKYKVSLKTLFGKAPGYKFRRTEGKGLAFSI